MARQTKDGLVIIVTRINGSRFAVNPDLLERVDVTGDTVLTLLDGTKYVVTESMEQVIDGVRQFRASIAAAALAGAGTDSGQLANRDDQPALFDANDTTIGIVSGVGAPVLRDADGPIAPAVPLHRDRRR